MTGPAVPAEVFETRPLQFRELEELARIHLASPAAAAGVMTALTSAPAGHLVIQCPRHRGKCTITNDPMLPGLAEVQMHRDHWIWAEQHMDLRHTVPAPLDTVISADGLLTALAGIRPDDRPAALARCGLRILRGAADLCGASYADTLTRHQAISAIVAGF